MLLAISRTISKMCAKDVLLLIPPSWETPSGREGWCLSETEKKQLFIWVFLVHRLCFVLHSVHLVFHARFPVSVVTRTKCLLAVLPLVVRPSGPSAGIARTRAARKPLVPSVHLGHSLSILSINFDSWLVALSRLCPIANCQPKENLSLSLTGSVSGNSPSFNTNSNFVANPAWSRMSLILPDSLPLCITPRAHVGPVNTCC